MTRYLISSVGLLVLGLVPLFAQELLTHSYFPLNIGDRWVYRVVDLKKPGKADSKKTVVIEVERQEPYALKKTEKDKVVTETHIGFILKSTSGGKTTRDHVIVLKDGVYRIHAAGTPITPALLFFKLGKEPSWEVNSTSGNTTIKGKFTMRPDKVTVPYGKLDTIRISFDNNKKGDEERVEIDYWFADGIGMVKQRVREKDREFALELERFEKKK